MGEENKINKHIIERLLDPRLSRSLYLSVPISMCLCLFWSRTDLRMMCKDAAGLSVVAAARLLFGLSAKTRRRRRKKAKGKHPAKK